MGNFVLPTYGFAVVQSMCSLNAETVVFGNRWSSSFLITLTPFFP